MRWKGDLFIDICLPFGVRLAPKLFNTLADMLSWILDRNEISPLIHYLDNFLTMRQADSAACHNHLTTIKEVCQDFGIPLALEKVEGSSQCLTFLGITVDTKRMEARLPSDKLLHIRNQLLAWLTRKSTLKGTSYPLSGCCSMPAKLWSEEDPLCLACTYITSAKLKHLSHYTRLTKDFRSDLYWWHTFVNIWNGASLLNVRFHQTNFDCFIQTDAFGSWGVVHSSTLTGFSMLGALNGLQLISWQNN